MTEKPTLKKLQEEWDKLPVQQQWEESDDYSMAVIDSGRDPSTHRFHRILGR